MRNRVRQDTCAPDFGTGSGRGWNADDRCDLVSIGTGPPVTDIFEIPNRAGLTAHEGDDLAEI
jgi:hypothetical protein